MADFVAPDLTRPPSPHEFERLARLGLGRAVLILQRHDAAPYRELLSEAVVEDWTYDGDTTNTRERYLLDLIDASGKNRRFRDLALAALPRAVNRDSALCSRTAEQIVRLLSFFAQRGDSVVRSALRRAFEADPLAFPDALVFIDQDDWPGLVYVARMLGVPLIAGQVDAVAERLWPVQHRAEERWGNERAWLNLREDAHGDPAIIAVAEAGLERWQPTEPPDRRFWQDQFREVRYDQLFEEPAERKRRRWDSLAWLRGWGRCASGEDIARLACHFTSLGPDRPDQIARCLQVFADRSFPLDPSYLIREVRRGDLTQPLPRGYHGEWNLDERRVWYALLALENVVHPAVRALGLEFLGRKGWVGSGAGLLERNAGPGDLTRIVDAFVRAPDVDERHGIGMSISELSERQLPPGIAEALCHVYEFGPCECCRSSIVRRLIDLEALPAWMADECRYDADDGIREAVANREGR